MGETMIYDYFKIMLDGHRAKMARHEGGATGVEYGLLVALIAAVIVAVVVILGNKIANAFSKVNNAITT
jgi:pilus assembly protein Flp/PilA